MREPLLESQWRLALPPGQGARRLRPRRPLVIVATDRISAFDWVLRAASRTGARSNVDDIVLARLAGVRHH